jgi:hypothetical protein
MKALVTIALTTLVALSGCQEAEVGPWFEGSFDAALVEAGSRGELLFVEFYSDT